MQFHDRGARGSAFVTELLERGADEDPQALIGCTNDPGGASISHPSPPGLAHGADYLTLA